jgi:hypothetical protein
VTERPLIAAVHATPASIAPLTAALADELPGAQLWNIIDDRLGPDADAVGGELTPELRDRMLNLVRYGVTGRADAVVIACSMYGGVREIAEKVFTTPVFSSDADMMADIVRPRPAGVFFAGRGGRLPRLRAMLVVDHPATEVVPVFCPGGQKPRPAPTSPRWSALANAPKAGGQFDGLHRPVPLSPAADDLPPRSRCRCRPPRAAAGDHAPSGAL